MSKYINLGTYDMGLATEEQFDDWLYKFSPLSYFKSEFGFYNKDKTPKHKFIQSVSVDIMKHKRERIDQWVKYMEPFKVNEEDVYSK